MLLDGRVTGRLNTNNMSTRNKTTELTVHICSYVCYFRRLLLSLFRH